MKSYIHLIRHGVTEANKKRLYYGYSDIPLADDGVDAVKALNAEGIYPKPKKAAYYTSGLLRAEQTLSLIYGEIPHTRLEALKEFFFGEYELKTHAELKDDPEYIFWINDTSGVSAPPGGESAVLFRERVKRGFAAILDGHSNGDNGADSAYEHSVAVCHGGVICVIMASCFDDYGEDMFQWIPDPGHGYTIVLEDGRPSEYTSF